MAAAQNPSVNDEVYNSASRERTSRPALCGNPSGPFSAGDLPFEPEIQVEADSVSVSPDGASSFKGNVELRFEQRILNAGEMTYDREQEILRSRGGINYRDTQVSVQGESLTLDAGQRSVEFTEADFSLADTGARGKAKRLAVANNGYTELNDSGYSTCPGENPDWQIVASKITIDTEEDIGTARNARLNFKGVPVLYLPYISFPTSSKRKSGLLLPRLGSSNETGLDIAQPYYWNIAPNKDATITPRFLSDRGLKLDTEFRYLTERHEGELRFDFLPNDERFEGSRSLLSYHQLSRFNDRLEAEIDYARASDNEYLSDYGNSLDLASTSFLQQQIEGRYYADWYRITAAVEQYQLLDNTVTNADDEPYSLLPRVHFAGLRSLGGYWQLQLDADAVNFQESSQDISSTTSQGDRATGSRFDLYPKLLWNYRKPGFYIEPSVGWRSTVYKLSGNDSGNSQTRDLPIAKVDAGLVFERNINIGPLERTQTFEPRLQYLYVGRRDQNDLPLFDTAVPDFNISRVFAENRLIGVDRISSARRVSLGATSRFLRPDGRETLRLQLAQAIDLDDTNIDILGTTGRRSDLIFAATSIPNDNWRGTVELHYDSNDNRFVRNAFQVGYYSGERLVNIGYRSRREPIKLEQTDVSFAWPINERWRAVGRWNYSLEDHATIESLAGFEYQSCCYAARTVLRRFREPGSGELDYRLFFELELRGLTAIGNRVESVLERGILGYGGR